MALRTGGCRCGRLRYELTGELGFTFHGHCSFCRRIHGSAFTTREELEAAARRKRRGAAR